MPSVVKRLTFFSVLPIGIVMGLALAGLVAVFVGTSVASVLLMAVLIVGVSPYVWRMLTEVFRGHFGVDIIALLAILTALALGQYVAGTIILLMLSGGEALEEYALARAKLQLTQLLSRAPSRAHRKRSGKITDVSVNRIAVKDVLVVKPGETVPVDAVVLEGRSQVDESMITGEPLPVEKTPSHHIVSGSVNLEGVLVVRAMRVSKDSKYEQIVRLVREASEQKTPIVRLADRYSSAFTLVTLAVSGFAWFISGDPLRALAVLVVATPCPLIIATPVAIMSGISLAAARGIVVKNGGALEQLARVRAFIFDKTGTITFGHPTVSRVFGFGVPVQEVLRQAASLDQLSAHVLARSLVTEARKKRLPLEIPEGFHETLAQGVWGMFQGKGYALGKFAFLRSRGVVMTQAVLKEYHKREAAAEKIVFLARGKRVLGGFAFADKMRTDTKRVFETLRSSGVPEIVLLSGDKSSVVAKMASATGITRAIGDLTPEEKVKELKRLQKRFTPVAMVGDGINDAPALATADVGIAMGAQGATVASETADIVIAVDELSRVAEARLISLRMLRIAKQSIFVGMGVSLVLMVAAANGYVTPIIGAFLQEGLDVFVILNALRVHRMPKS